MRWLEADEVRCTPIGAERDGWSVVSLGTRSRAIRGLVLEQAALLDPGDPIQGYLFVTTDDVPYEESLTITLTDPALRPLDTVRLGWIYATGGWANATIDGPGRVSFEFFDEKRWHLTVLPRPTLRLSFTGPTGSWRSFGFRQHLTLGTTPLQDA